MSKDWSNVQTSVGAHFHVAAHLLDASTGLPVDLTPAPATGGFVGVVADSVNLVPSSVADSEYGALSWSGLVDTDGFHSGSDPHIVIPDGMAGTYLLSAQASFDATDAGTKRKLTVTLNNSGVVPALQVVPTATYVVLTIMAALTLGIGDIVALKGWQDTGGAMAVYVTSLVFQKIA